MRLGQSLRHGLVAVHVIVLSAITVGLTASPRSTFTIAVRPALFRLALDLDVKLGTMHLHAGWSALPSLPESTKPATDRF